MTDTHWINKHPFQASRDQPDYCRCGAHKAHPEHEVSPEVERSRNDIAYIRMQAARRCAEIAERIREELGAHNDPAWNAAEMIAEEIRKEFGLTHNE